VAQIEASLNSYVAEQLIGAFTMKPPSAEYCYRKQAEGQTEFRREM
jgi:hypothetical protein